MSRLTLTAFAVGSLVFCVGLIVWLITMIRDRSPLWPRRITLGAAGLAIAALLLNAFT
ncbi:hypothetical protein [Lacticaseibacillus absianus]|uniref:hypothetical protein n=1 Tax=Lacticaseibacillus absianus TaxID=2729623 RepID=UPI0015C9BCD2|nr:hypothetical protein [Lacticaseibacillus absianus]